MGAVEIAARRVKIKTPTVASMEGGVLFKYKTIQKKYGTEKNRTYDNKKRRATKH